MSERIYLDTSAALKLVLDEGETSELLAARLDEPAVDLVGIRLLETEMRRAAHRNPDLHQDTVTAFLATIDLHSITDVIFRQAGALSGDLRSLGALHLASTLALNVDAIATYDLRLAANAGDAGLEVIAPGQPRP